MESNKYLIKEPNSWYFEKITAKTLLGAKIIASKLVKSDNFALYRKFESYSEVVAIKENGKWRNI